MLRFLFVVLLGGQLFLFLRGTPFVNSFRGLHYSLVDFFCQF